MIEEHWDEIIALGKEAYKTPELGSKEFRTGKTYGGSPCKLGLEPETGVSYTGCRCVLPVPRETAQGGGDGRWTASCATSTRMQLRAEWFMPAGIMCSWLNM